MQKQSSNPTNIRLISVEYKLGMCTTTSLIWLSFKQKLIYLYLISRLV